MSEDKEQEEKATLEDVVRGGVTKMGINPWKEIFTIENEEDDWKRSVQVMEIAGVGCVVKNFVQLDDMVTESMVFVPGVKVKEGKVVKDE